MSEENKALVRRFIEAIDTGDIGILEQFVDPSYNDHNPPPFPGLSHGIEGSRQAFSYALNAFSDFRHEVGQQVAEGDTVVSVITGYGRHTGDFVGIPATNKEVQMTGIAIHRIQNGKLVEHWGQIDAMGLLQQLGAIPHP